MKRFSLFLLFALGLTSCQSEQAAKVEKDVLSSEKEAEVLKLAEIPAKKWVRYLERARYLITSEVHGAPRRTVFAFKNYKSEVLPLKRKSHYLVHYYCEVPDSQFAIVVDTSNKASVKLGETTISYNEGVTESKWDQ